MAIAEDHAYSFLPYRKNPSLNIQAIINHGYDPAYAQRPLLYKKPADICQQPGVELPLFWQEKASFAREWRQQIECYAQALGLSLLTTSDGDIHRIKDFLARRYCPEMANEICAFDLHRFSQYGHCLVLKDASKEVQGTIFEIGYDTPEKTSYTVRLAVDQQLEGQNLGYHLMMYSSLLAMEQGSRVKRGIIQFDNIRSLYVNLNKVGWICEGFDPNIPGLGAFFHIALPLDPTGLTSNAIDREKLLAFIRSHRSERDFLLLDAEDLEGVSALYADTDFKVVAVIPPGWTGSHAQFFALPAAAIQLDTRYRPYKNDNR